MGHNRVVAGSNFHSQRARQTRSLFSTIHEAQIKEVHLDAGTVSLVFVDIGLAAEAEIPMVAMSAPPAQNGEDSVSAFSRAAWGRYVPQVGDVVRVGFSSNGKVFILSYSSMVFPLFDVADKAKESRGGIGWGEASGKELKPGDWEFKSSRGSFFDLTNKVKMSSGGLSLTLDKPANEIVQSASLSRSIAGNSYCNLGEVRRFVLPTDQEKSNIFSTRPTVGIIPFDVAKEFNVSVRWAGNIPSANGTELASMSIGDVVDDSLPVPILMMSSGGGNVRFYRNVQNMTGFVSALSEKIDDLGNYEVSSLLGTMFTWTTPLAMWDITNLSTAFVSSTSFDVTSPTINFTGMVNLGSSSPVDAVLKGTSFVNGLTNLLTDLNVTLVTIGSEAATAVLGSSNLDPSITKFVGTLGAHTAKMATAISLFSSSLNSMLSLTVKTL